MPSDAQETPCFGSILNQHLLKIRSSEPPLLGLKPAPRRAANIRSQNAIVRFSVMVLPKISGSLCLCCMQHHASAAGHPGTYSPWFLRKVCGNLGTVLRMFRENACGRAAELRPLREDAVVEDQNLQVLDSAALNVLKDEAGDGASRRFVEEYLLMLPTRAARIIKGLAGEDPEPTSRALISLRVTSAMAGALRLEGFCADLERALERGRNPGTVSVKQLLFANIRLVVHAAAGQGYFPTHPQPVCTARRAAPRYETPMLESC